MTDNPLTPELLNDPDAILEVIRNDSLRGEELLKALVAAAWRSTWLPGDVMDRVEELEAQEKLWREYASLMNRRLAQGISEKEYQRLYELPGLLGIGA